jgi:predicted permease
MFSLLQDVRFALRQARSRPGFTLVVILVLALGLGANAAIFSVVNPTLLQPLPYPDPSGLVLLWERGVLAEGGGENIVSMPSFLDWQKQSRSFEGMAAARGNQFNLGADRGFAPERIEGAIVSGTLLPVLGVQPLIGRNFRPEEDQNGGPRVTLISHGLWQSRFGGAKDILQRSIRLDDQSYQIIGVMPRDFSYPRRDTQVWAPIQQVLSKETIANRGDHEFYVLARLRHGVSIEQARTELESIQHRLWETHGKGTFGRGAMVSLLAERIIGSFQTTLRLLLGAVACVLLIACVNIANLLLARGSQRQREVAIRAALGARWSRLVRQLLTEAVSLSLAGAALGLLLAWFLTDYLAGRAKILLNARGDFDASGNIHLDGWVFLFTAVIALVAGIATGIVPALQAARADLTIRLKDNSRSTTAGRGQNRFRYALITAEVALTLVLLISAGLLLQSFISLRNVHPGVRTDHILTAGLSLPDARYAKRELIAAFHRQLVDGLRALPGVRSAGLVSCLPVTGWCGDDTFNIEGRPLPPGQFFDAINRAASPNYFSTAGIPILRGRTFTDHDGIGFDDKHLRQSAVIISQSMAREFFPNEDPIGKRIYYGDEKSTRFEIIGVCGDVIISLDDRPRPTMYQPIFDGNFSDFYAVVNTAADPQGLASAVRAEINRLDANLPVFEVRTMQDILSISAEHRQFTALLIGCFALLALVLAAVGLYGVLFYIVAQRTNEIGIRMVLGANAPEVRRLVLWQGMQPVFVGIALGLAGAIAATRYFESLLFSVKSRDPATFVLVTALLVAVALIACSIPALRATRIDPAVALRME